MSKTLLLALTLVAGIAHAQQHTTASAQRIISDNFKPADCGKVVEVYNRRGGGQAARCSNGEVYMFARYEGKDVAMRCSMLDRFRRQGIDLGVSTAQCIGR